MSENFNLPTELEGLVLPTVELVIKKGQAGGLNTRQMDLGRGLAYLLELREKAISIKPYKEHTFSQIATVSYGLLEEPLEGTSDTNPWKGITALDERLALTIEKERIVEERNKALNADIETYYDYIIKEVTPEGLEYITSFHYLLDGLMTDLYDLKEEFPKLMVNFKLRYDQLVKEYGEMVQDHHIIPETIDWNCYLSVRGPVPGNLQSHYDLVLERALKLYKVEEARRRARKYLGEHPEQIRNIVKGEPPISDPELPREVQGVRILVEEAEKLMKSGVKVLEENTGGL